MFKKLCYGIFAVFLALIFTTCKEADYSTTAKTFTGITLNTVLVKKAYVQNESLNLSGLIVTANYSDGSGAAVANYTTNPAHGAALTAAGNITVTISYTEGGITKTADFSVTVTAGINFGGGDWTPEGYTPIRLTENQWADGSLPTGSSQQWFVFTATAPTQYIHFEPGTLTWVSVQFYDSGGATVGSETGLPGVLQSLTAGQTYYIRLKPFFSSNSGTYRIGFNPLPAVPDTTFIPLTENKWANGNLPTSSDEQWFRFTATSSTQYIYVDFGTLRYLSVQVYNSSGNAVGSGTEFMSFLTTNSTSRTLTIGQTYYIRARSDIYLSSGTYRIGFNTSSYAAPNY